MCLRNDSKSAVQARRAFSNLTFNCLRIWVRLNEMIYLPKQTWYSSRGVKPNWQGRRCGKGHPGENNHPPFKIPEDGVSAATLTLI